MIAAAYPARCRRLQPGEGLRPIEAVSTFEFVLKTVMDTEHRRACLGHVTFRATQKPRGPW